MQLIECVANISEGTDHSLLQAVVDAAAGGGAAVLNVDSSRGAARSVITIAGTPAAVAESAFRLVAEAARHIDMRTYRGVHPCIGAADVVPFVPLCGAAFEECCALAVESAKRMGAQLEIPVYLYGACARSPRRKRLAYLRRGGYAQLAARIASGELSPDEGPGRVGPAGATVVGARPLMLAYNIALATCSVETAAQIAAQLRESGAAARDEHGKLLHDSAGRAARRPGCFKGCEAIGWYMEDFECAQVSINLRDFDHVPLHAVFEKTCALAEASGTAVRGSEVIGLLPKRALLAAGAFYRRRPGSEEELLRAAAAGLRLDALRPFDAAQKVLEHRLAAVGLLNTAGSFCL